MVFGRHDLMTRFLTVARFLPPRLARPPDGRRFSTRCRETVESRRIRRCHHSCIRCRHGVGCGSAEFRIPRPNPATSMNTTERGVVGKISNPAHGCVAGAYGGQSLLLEAEMATTERRSSTTPEFEAAAGRDRNRPTRRSRPAVSAVAGGQRIRRRRRMRPGFGAAATSPLSRRAERFGGQVRQNGQLPPS